MVKLLREEFGLNLCCHILGIAKNTVYNWRDKTEVIKAKYKYLKPVVEQICEDTRGYGKRRLSAELKRRGYNIGEKLANKFNTYWGNWYMPKESNYGKSPITKTIEKLGKRANLLSLMNLKEVMPFEVTRTDATEIVYFQGRAKACFNSRIDECSKFLLGWAVSFTPDTSSAIKALEQEEVLRKQLGLTFEGNISHQDQGSVYTGYEYAGWLLNRGALLSYSKRATPGDNAAKESFFGRQKKETREVFLECDTLGELTEALAEMVQYYNFRRLHSSLGQKPPIEFLEALGYKL